MLLKIRQDPREVGLDTRGLDLPYVIWISPLQEYVLLENHGDGPWDWHEAKDETPDLTPVDRGPPGPSGPQGYPGSKGAPGDSGASAYLTAVSLGFVGTEAEWLLTLVGPQGPQGEPGEGSSDVSELAYEVVLNEEPVPLIGFPLTYNITRTGPLVTLEEWFSGATLVKSIAYTYTGSAVNGEVRKVFDTDGTTILAQTTYAYTYTGSLVTSATITRNV